MQYKRAPLKKHSRVFEKIDRSYNGDASRVLDFVRASLVATSVREARSALEFVMERAVVKSIKNRLDSDYDGKDTAGYRDVNLQLTFAEVEKSSVYKGFVFELQIILQKFIDIKSDHGHRLYVQCRNLRGD